MIDLHLLRQNPQEIKTAILKKEPNFAVDTLISLDKQVRTIKQEVEALRAQKNELAKQVSSKEQFEKNRAQSIQIGTVLKSKEEELTLLEAQFQKLYLECPNIPDVSVPFGSKADNKAVKTWGKQKTFDFVSKNHLELAQNGFVDFDTAAKLSGAHFAFYQEEGAKLLYALSMFMLKHNMSHGFSLCLPPLLVKEEPLIVSGNFPKFRDSVFYTPTENLYLTPTSEVNLTNLYSDHIFAASELPIRKTAWTSCFRTEGGGYGAQERGLIRLRQFEKVELVSFVVPEKSFEELDFMVSVAEGILQKLDLPYQISLLASGDCSFQSAKTYDIEVWLPGQKEYKEISSASNCTDFQARRGLIRYKKHPEDKASFVHTLNASSLALPRLMVAIMETYQNSDGTVSIPEILKPFYL